MYPDDTLVFGKKYCLKSWESKWKWVWRIGKPNIQLHYQQHGILQGWQNNINPSARIHPHLGGALSVPGLITICALGHGHQWILQWISRYSSYQWASPIRGTLCSKLNWWDIWKGLNDMYYSNITVRGKIYHVSSRKEVEQFMWFVPGLEMTPQCMTQGKRIHSLKSAESKWSVLGRIRKTDIRMHY